MKLGDISAAIGDVCRSGGLLGQPRLRRARRRPHHARRPARRRTTAAPDRGLKLRPGLVIAIEPWLLETTDELYTDPDGWTLRSADGSRGAHTRAHGRDHRRRPDRPHRARGPDPRPPIPIGRAGCSSVGQQVRAGRGGCARAAARGATRRSRRGCRSAAPAAPRGRARRRASCSTGTRAARPRGSPRRGSPGCRRRRGRGGRWPRSSPSRRPRRRSARSRRG